jgi:hypothetical protein
MKRGFFLLVFQFIMLNSAVNGFAQFPYEVVMVRGKVTYNGQELKRGDKLELSDLSDALNMQGEFARMDFGSGQDFLQLLDASRRKIVVIPAQAANPGRDLMLATRGVKFIRSDFEFQRAFNPGESALVLLTEDTVLCAGLDKYRFSGPVQLVARYDFDGALFESVIGHNDSLFLTRRHLFGGRGSDGEGLQNSFETKDLKLFLVNSDTGQETKLEDEIAPFQLYFLDDILSFFASAQFDGMVMDKEAIFHLLVPRMVSERQIQRTFGIYSSEEASNWLLDKIDQAFEGQ